MSNVPNWVMMYLRTLPFAKPEGFADSELEKKLLFEYDRFRMLPKYDSDGKYIGKGLASNVERDIGDSQRVLHEPPVGHEESKKVARRPRTRANKARTSSRK